MSEIVMSGVVVTAWDLSSGRTVYAAGEGAWTERLAEAELFADEEAAEPVLTAAAAQNTLVLDPYLVEVADGRAAGRAQVREAIRAAGPTVRADLGKQAGRP